MMRYGPHNVALGTSVYDVDAKLKIDRVLEVNADAGWVKVHAQPLARTAAGYLAQERIRFRAIHPIRGGLPVPCLFHCYGRL